MRTFRVIILMLSANAIVLNIISCAERMIAGSAWCLLSFLCATVSVVVFFDVLSDFEKSGTKS